MTDKTLRTNPLLGLGIVVVALAFQVALYVFDGTLYPAFFLFTFVCLPFLVTHLVLFGPKPIPAHQSSSDFQKYTLVSGVVSGLFTLLLGGALWLISLVYNPGFYLNEPKPFFEPKPDFTLQGFSYLVMVLSVVVGLAYAGYGYFQKQNSKKTETDVDPEGL